MPERPDLPQSVTPSWTRKSFEKAPPPAGVPARAAPECWKADYAGGDSGVASAWVCGYTSDGGAFDAMQRTETGANTVKFQEGRRLAVVRWNGASRDEIKALVLAVQRAMR